MPQSLSRVLCHLIFSTKNRSPLLTPDIQRELFPYLAVVLTNDGCPSLRVGGHVDHVHLLFGLSRNRSIADVVENVKTSSSKWIKSFGSRIGHFQWQSGYGIFSVSSSNADAVIAYIDNQEDHHRVLSFQDEFRFFLQKHQTDYDEKYVWD